MGNQKCTKEPSLGWDDPLSESLSREWQCWRDSFVNLENVFIPRCYHGKKFGQITRSELHAFSDASEEAIATVVYLKQIICKKEISISLAYAQAKLGRRQSTTILILELCAAVLSTQVVKRVLTELRITIDEVTYYTDSKVALSYIQNESRRFYVYVTNRIQIIRGLSDPTQWKYIDTHRNPADLFTRGSTVENLARAQ